MAKGTLTSFSCDLATNGFATERSYIVDRDGQQTYEIDGSGNWQHTNVYANGELLATYNAAAVHFYLEDWLGTKRGQASVTTSGTTATTTSELTCWSLPFGDDLICSGPGSDATEHHFTGKERDTEFQNDYFLARYYASNTVGRFLSPDFSSDPTGVPYGTYSNPQSLNLYSYVLNNPLTRTDPDGHVTCGPDISYTDQSGAVYLIGGICHLDWGDINELAEQIAQQAITTASQIGHQFTNIMNTPGGPGCMAGLAASGAESGAIAGGGFGLAGLAGGGVGVAVTEPAGLVVGGIGGGASGMAAGMTVCPGGAAFSGSGGGGGGATKETPKSNPEKFKPVRGTSAKVNTETGEVFVKDKSGHGGDHYEVYRSIRDFENGNRAYQVWADGSVGRSY